jgi:hypothetical protein
MSANVKITFKKEARRDVLGLINKTVDAEGFIVDNNQQRVLTIDGEEIQENEFGGIRLGSEIFIKGDLPSLMELSKV